MGVLTSVIGAAIAGAVSSAAAAGGGAALAAGAGALAAGVGAATALSKKGGGNTPTYNAEAEKRKAAMQEAEANKKRALSETRTIQTSALGHASGTQTQKKTLLGG